MMGNVVAFKRGTNQGDLVEVCTRLLMKAQRGELRGLIHFEDCSDEPNRILVTGVFADRLQYAAYTLVKGLDVVVDQLATSPTMGFSRTDAMEKELPLPAKPRLVPYAPLSN